MAFESNGKLMVRLPGPNFRALSMQAFSADSSRIFLGGGETEPLFMNNYARTLAMGFDAAPASESDWVLHRPATIEAGHPWDAAHEFIERSNRLNEAKAAVFAEPDLRHMPYPANVFGDTAEGLNAMAAVAVVPGVLPQKDLNEAYPPNPTSGFRPAWHLDAQHGNFEAAWAFSRGTGVRIAHLDTGCTPEHSAAPRHLLLDQGGDYADPQSPTLMDQESSKPWNMPGHGTGTLGLLAGGNVNLRYRGQSYVGDLGGAPDANVVPVRIGRSVVHLYGSQLARGLMHALHPGRGAPPCDVVSLSHGGLPSASWADAVNQLYENGIVVVAASGDSFHAVIMDLATHYTVYPSAFYRVITATGVTYTGGPYKKSELGVMQGCWGPRKVMLKAIGASTPNVPWLTYHHSGNWTNTDWEADGGGTSASTPQIAAACALWLSTYGANYPRDWRRVTACRHALFASASRPGVNIDEIGVGSLNAGAMLDANLAESIQLACQAGAKPFDKPIERDRVSFPFFRLLFGLAPPGSGVDEMYELEAQQLLYMTRNKDFFSATAAYDSDETRVPDAATLRRLRDDFISEPNMSRTLKARLSQRAMDL